MLPNEIWIPIAIAMIVFTTILLIRSLYKKEESLWSSLKKWIVNVIDILSGGGV